LNIYEKEKTSKESVNYATTLYNIGRANYDEGKYNESLKSTNKALVIYEKENNESMSCALCLDIIGNVYC
jgi:tetratricopeptide (TPR) repeat protein